MTTVGGETADLFIFTACGKYSNDNFVGLILRKILFHTKVLLAICIYIYIYIYIYMKPTHFSGYYLRNRSTLDIGVLGYIGIV